MWRAVTTSPSACSVKKPAALSWTPSQSKVRAFEGGRERERDRGVEEGRRESKKMGEGEGERERERERERRWVGAPFPVDMCSWL